MSVTSEQVKAGQGVYTKRTLSCYDFLVLGISNRFLWKCPTQRLEEHYSHHLTANHLDVGVGTGYFLDHCRFPSSTPRVALMDLNSAALEFASQRIARYKPETYRRNVLEPISLDAGMFDSVGINYLLHCVPGSNESKSVAFDHLKALMNPNAVLFGSTLLQGGVTRSWFAKRLMDAYNKKGIFSNQADHLEGLKRALHQRFRGLSRGRGLCRTVFGSGVKPNQQFLRTVLALRAQPTADAQPLSDLIKPDRSQKRHIASAAFAFHVTAQMSCLAKRALVGHPEGSRTLVVDRRSGLPPQAHGNDQTTPVTTPLRPP